MEKSEPTRRSSRNLGQRRYDGSDSSLGDEVAEYEDKKKGKKKSLSKPPTPSSASAIDPNDKKRGRPSKDIGWDTNYTGPLRRCAYIGHEELWGPDVPVELQPQYFYKSSTTARCIYCYKHLCNERHANKSKDKAAGISTTKKKGRNKRTDDEDEEDEIITPTPTTKRGRSSVKKRSKNGSVEEEEWNTRRNSSSSSSRMLSAKSIGNHPPNVLHNAEQSLMSYTNGPRILQEWQSPPVATMEYTFAGMPQGARPLQIKVLNNGANSTLLQPAQFTMHTANSILINATPQATCLGWVSSDILVIGGGSTLQVWGGLNNFANPHLMYTLMLEGGNVVSLQVLPRSGIPKIRYAALAAVHLDGRVRLHSLPIPGVNEQQPLMIRQLGASPVSVSGTSPVQSLAVSSHPSHPNRLILGHQDGSLRWVDLPSNPQDELPNCQGNGGAGFSIAAAGYLPTSDAAFWAVGDSASVAIGDIREPFGGPAAPSGGGGNTESYLKTADSSLVFPALVAGGDGGHVWALPWAGEHTPPPRLLCSLNGAALSIRCHPFLPLAIAGCASGAARALWLPTPQPQNKNQHQLIIHAASEEDDRAIVVDSPADLSDNGFKNAGILACCSSGWAPDLDGRYAVAHSGGLVRVGVIRDFILRSSK